MYLAIKEVKPQADYLLLLTFENGEKRQCDVKPYLHLGIFQELKDEGLFKPLEKVLIQLNGQMKWILTRNSYMRRAKKWNKS